MKSILFVTNVCARGGAENQIFLLIKKMAKLKQFELSIAFFQVRDSALANDLKGAGITVYDFGAPRKLSLKPLRALNHLMRSQSFDLVHSHLSYPDWMSAMVHKRYPKFKLIQTIHNCESLFKWLPVQWFYRWLINPEFTWTICISKAVQDQVVRLLKIPPARTSVVYYGYESETQIQLSTNRVYAGLDLLFLARLVPQKNHVFLFQVLAQLRDRPIKVKIAGAGRKSYENYLRSVVFKLKIGHMVEFLGSIADPAPLIQNCDALILTSKWEGFGLVLLEAMALSKPVIATDIAPINEVVKNGETGWLVASGDQHALKNALIEVLKDRSALLQRGHAGLKRATQYFSEQRMVSEILGIIGKI